MCTSLVYHILIIGNINDRSLLGERDSEMAIIVEDQNMVSIIIVATGGCFMI